MLLNRFDGMLVRDVQSLNVLMNAPLLVPVYWANRPAGMDVRALHPINVRANVLSASPTDVPLPSWNRFSGTDVRPVSANVSLNMLLIGSPEIPVNIPPMTDVRLVQPLNVP